MTLVKLTDGESVVVFYVNYNDSVAHVNALCSIAKEDFPQLDDSKVSTHTLGGDRYKNMTAISFVLPQNALIPNGYTVVNELPLFR